MSYVLTIWLCLMSLLNLGVAFAMKSSKYQVAITRNSRLVIGLISGVFAIYAITTIWGM